MPGALLGFARDTLPTAAVLILLLAITMMVAAMKYREGAVKEPGPDRDHLIRSPRLGGSSAAL